MPVLETPRLLLRPFSPDDLAAIHRLLAVELGKPDPSPLAAQASGPFDQLPSSRPAVEAASERPYSTELGLYYAVAPSHHRQGPCQRGR